MLVRMIPLALLASWWSATAISAQPMVPDELVPSVTVVGTGDAEGRPDMAHFTVGVITEAPTAAEALSANSEAMNRLMAALEEHEIEERDIQTVQFDISPQFRRDPPSRRPPPRREMQLQQEPMDDEQPIIRRQPQPRQEGQLQEAPQVWDEPQVQHEPRIVGYQVSNQVRVRVRDLDRLGEILDAVVRQEANRLHGVGFAIDDPEEND